MKCDFSREIRWPLSALLWAKWDRVGGSLEKFPEGELIGPEFVFTRSADGKSNKIFNSSYSGSSSSHVAEAGLRRSRLAMPGEPQWFCAEGPACILCLHCSLHPEMPTRGAHFSGLNTNF